MVIIVIVVMYRRGAERLALEFRVGYSKNGCVSDPSNGESKRCQRIVLFANLTGSRNFNILYLAVSHFRAK